MADIPTFDAKAPRRGNLDVSGISGGQAETWSALASGASRIAARLGAMADKARVAEVTEQGKAAGNGASMPSVDFAFSGNAPATTPAPRKGGARSHEARDYLMRAHGFSLAQASAIAGHGMAESNLNPDVSPGDNGTAFGLFQWRGDRLAGLKRFAAERGTAWNDFHLQLDYAVHELNTSEASAGRALRAATTVEDATAAFMSFERPQGWTPQNPRGGHNFSGRLAFAKGLLDGSAPPDGSITSAVPAQKLDATVSGAFGPLPQMKAGTLAGDAFNAAARDTYMNNADTALRSAMDALALQHPDDPAALADALDASFAGMTDGMPPDAKAELGQTFARAKATLTFQAADAFNKKLERETLASFETNIAARTDGALRRAASLPNTPEGDQAVSAELSEVATQIDRSNLDPLEKERKKRELANDVLSARVMAGFEAQDTPDKRAAYAANFDAEWKASEGFAGQVDASARDKINGAMAKALDDERQAADKRGKALQDTIDGQVGFLKKGLPVSQAAISAIRSEVERTGSAELSANLGFLDGLATWQRTAAGQPPERISGQIAALKRQMAEKGTTKAAEVTLDVMETLQTNMRKALAGDMLSFAQGAGIATLEPLDFSNAAAMQASMAARAADAKAVASRYGVPPQFFTEGERDSLSKLMADDPASLPQLATGLVSALGKDAPTALKEISKDAPLLAHMGGLIAANGNQRFAVDVAEALAMRKADGYKSALPGDKALADAAAETIGAALSRDPETASRAIDTATAAFERRLVKRGISAKDFDREGSPARAEFQAAVNEALGARFIGGVQYGGITEVNGFETIAPADLPADALQNAVALMLPSDLAGAASANGIPFTSAQLRRSHLISVGDGLYRLALGDPFSDEPQILRKADGSPFELDIRALAKRTAAEQRRAADGPEWQPVTPGAAPDYAPEWQAQP